jgi:predicted O-linked N-acetylglucosamine transferase (SPINDLY family)
VEALSRLLVDPDRSAIERALASPPIRDDASAVGLLSGELARRAGDAARAVALLETGLSAWPAVLPAWHSAALARLAAGDRDGARALWQRLLERNPEDRIARYQIALSFHDERRIEHASTWYVRQLERQPADARASHNLGLCRQEAGAIDDAIAAFRRAVEIDAGRFASWLALGTALRTRGDPGAAIDALRRAQVLAPGDIRPLVLAANAWGDLAELPNAIALLEQAIAIAPGDASLRWSIASHLSNLGAHAQALERFREARALDPGDARGHSAFLLELQYESSFASRDELAREHWAWGEQHANGLPRIPRAAPRRVTRDGGRLRIGYLSPRFGAGPLANLFLPVLREHDRSRFDVRLYSAYEHGDDSAAAMRAAAGAWRTLPASDDDAARLIAEDDLDLLIDLAGHAPGHRLGVLARKPAPVQATWLDYFETTGVDAVDYLVSDPVHTPPGDVPHFRERLALLPGCRFVYATVVAPALTAPPSVASGFVTFGSFNRHAKISHETLALWREVLAAIPGSRLRLRASAYRGAGTIAWVQEEWRRRGMPVDRIDFLPYVPLEIAMRDYVNVDVALDTVPYNGGITTCDALAAGVPVVTLAGERMIARQSAALLLAAGRPEWVARDAAGFVAIARSLAERGALAPIRESLGRSFPHTPLCDVAGFVASFERLIVRMIESGPRDASRGAGMPLTLD